MLPRYDDIIERAGIPHWYDEHGVPRYGEFRPEKVTVYGKEVALYRIECQSCQRFFNVSYVFKTYDFWIRRSPEWGGPPALPAHDVSDEEREQYAQAFKTWFQNVKDHVNEPDELSFGDPPRHGNCVGDTMGSIPVETRQWWKLENFYWTRVPHLEGISLREEAPPYDEDLPDEDL